MVGALLAYPFRNTHHGGAVSPTRTRSGQKNSRRCLCILCSDAGVAEHGAGGRSGCRLHSALRGRVRAQCALGPPRQDQGRPDRGQTPLAVFSRAFLLQGTSLLVTLWCRLSVCLYVCGRTPPPKKCSHFHFFMYFWMFHAILSAQKIFSPKFFSSMSCGWSKAQHNATKHSSFFSDVSSNENKISFLHVSGAAVGRGRQIWQIVWIFVALLSYETTSHVIKQDSNKPGCHWVQDRLIFYDSGSTLFWPKHHCLLLLQVGISVSSGALTACSSACWLLGAKIIFFQQFGIFMVTTLGFSLLWALGFFTTACGVFGPQGDFGCITKIIKSIFCKSKKNDNA